MEFRLRHLKDPRARAVIEAAAQRAGWRANAKGDGVRGRGFAFARYKNLACYCATAADVEVDRKTFGASTPRGRGATATTAPTTSRSTRRWSPGRPGIGR